jgi:hypothetical protein
VPGALDLALAVEVLEAFVDPGLGAADGMGELKGDEAIGLGDECWWSAYVASRCASAQEEAMQMEAQFGHPGARHRRCRTALGMPAGGIGRPVCWLTV